MQPSRFCRSTTDSGASSACAPDFRVAIRAGVPIIPVGLIGVDQIQTANNPLWMMRIRKETIVRIGEPIATERYAAGPN